MSELKFTNITQHYTVTGVGGGRIPSRARIGQSLPYLLLWRQSFLWEIQNNMIFISFNLFYFSGGKRKTPQGKELARALLWFRAVLLLQSWPSSTLSVRFRTIWLFLVLPLVPPVLDNTWWFCWCPNWMLCSSQIHNFYEIPLVDWITSRLWLSWLLWECPGLWSWTTVE